MPVGAFAARALGRALVAAPLALLAGVLCLAGGGSFALLLLGRGLVGVGHSLSILAGLTVILRLENPRRGVMSLNVFEFGGMVGFIEEEPRVKDPVTPGFERFSRVLETVELWERRMRLQSELEAASKSVERRGEQCPADRDR